MPFQSWKTANQKNSNIFVTYNTDKSMKQFFVCNSSWSYTYHMTKLTKHKAQALILESWASKIPVTIYIYLSMYGFKIRDTSQLFFLLSPFLLYT